MLDEPYKPRIFISYAHADEPEKPAEGEVKWLSFVELYLRPAFKRGMVDMFIDRHMLGGESWNSEIESRLRNCDIFILLVSPSSLSSDYVVEKEIALIRERQAKREDVHFYPLVLTPTPEPGLELVRDLDLRPRDGKAFSDYPLNERYRHMNEAANEIAAIAKNIAERNRQAQQKAEESAKKSEQDTFSNIPINVPLHFLGRDAELRAIDAALKSEKGRIAALHGLRGVGKSTLAAAYAERHKNDYRATWWIRAATPDTMRADLVALGVRLGWVAADEKEEPALDKVRDRLRHEGEGLLLVYDNAVDAASVRAFLPLAGAARALVTSNSPACRGVATPVEIPLWSKEVGADYLIARTGSEESRAVAEALSEALGLLPLAHEQAGSYCDRLGLSLAEYRNRFAAAPEPLLDTPKDASPDYHGGLTVAKAFALAIDEAAKLHPAAEPLIAYAAQLAPEPIPLFLFAEARETFGEPFASEIAGDGLDEAVAALRAFALVEREIIPDERDPSIATDSIRLHGLVRIAARARRQGEAAEAARSVLIKAMVLVYPRAVEASSSWGRMRRLDVLAFDLIVGSGWVPKGMEGEVAYILSSLGDYRVHGLGAYAQARPLLEQALSLREQKFGPAHAVTSNSLNDLAYVLLNMGDLQAARPLAERALTIRENAFGPDDATTGWSLNILARVLQKQGDPNAARNLCERALRNYEQADGPDHPNTAANLHNLAVILQDQGDLPAARQFLTRSLTISEATFGPKDHRTNLVRARLAGVELAEGRSTNALALARQALAAHDEVLGPDHLSTKLSAGIVASALAALGRGDEAAAVRSKYGIATGGAG